MISLHDGHRLVTLYGTSRDLELKTQQSSMNDSRPATKIKRNFAGKTAEQRSLKFRQCGRFLNSSLLFPLKVINIHKINTFIIM